MLEKSKMSAMSYSTKALAFLTSPECEVIPAASSSSSLIALFS
jgi:hypothetical protein